MDAERRIEGEEHMAQTVVITGASSGFGLLTAKTLAKKGHRVFAGVRDAKGRNAGAVRELGDAVTILDLDITSDPSVRAALDHVVQRAGRVDVVVNNAGVMSGGLDEAFSDDEMRRVFETNVIGVQRMFRAALPHMRKQGGGAFITVSSAMAQLTYPFSGLYCASKSAVEALVESYRYQLAPLGIDSVIAEPGGFPTALYDDGRFLYPAANDINASYGPLGEMPRQIFGGFAASLRAEGGPNPQDVADAITALVEAPLGTRPLRTVIDATTGPLVKAINGAASDAQKQLFAALGMTDLLEPKPR
jgi:NAD(P)-dependent dehydrogenase (short-subunit alcohol dehydrogenase family)